MSQNDRQQNSISMVFPACYLRSIRHTFQSCRSSTELNRTGNKNPVLQLKYFSHGAPQNF